MVLNIAIIHGINEQTPLLAPGEADVNCTIFPIETKALMVTSLPNISYFADRLDRAHPSRTCANCSRR